MQEEASLKAMPIPKEEASLKAMHIVFTTTKKAPKKDELLRSFFLYTLRDSNPRPTD